MSSRRLAGGYFYPLNVRRALDFDRGSEYVDACARRAREEPSSARREKGRQSRGYSSAKAREARARGP
jgi:hypothetical protein